MPHFTPKSWIAKGVMILLIVLLAVSIAGCWNRREVETLAFVTIAGVDRDPETGQIQLTAVIAKPSAFGTPTGGGGGAVQEKAFWVASSSGKTVFEAVRNLLAQSPRAPFWAHNRFIVFGEDFAREGIMEAIDFFNRDPEIRLTSFVLVAAGMKASEFLQTEFELEKENARALLGVLQGSRIRLGKVVTTNLKQFLIMLEGEGIEPVVQGVKVIRKRPGEPDGDVLRGIIFKSPELDGAAVFKRDRLVGFLTPKETRGFRWIKGDRPGGIVPVDFPEGRQTRLSLEITRSTSSVKTKLENGIPSVSIEITAQFNLGDASDFIDPFKNRELTTAIEETAQEAIRKEAEAAVKRAKELNSDIFGFGASLNRSFPEEWKSLKDRWDIIFPHLEVQIKVKATMSYTGLVKRTVQTR